MIVSSSGEQIPSSLKTTLLLSLPVLMRSASKPASSIAPIMWSESVMLGSKWIFASSSARPITAFLTPSTIKRARSIDSEQLVHAIPLILNRHTAISCSGNSSTANPRYSMASLIFCTYKKLNCKGFSSFHKQNEEKSNQLRNIWKL